jgi:HEAT repeat protein
LSNDSEKDIRDKSVQGIVNLYLPREGGLGATVNKVANFLNPWSDEWADVVVEPGVTVDPTAVSALQQRLQDSDEGIRIKAARALGILRGKAAIPVMLDGLNQDRSNTVRFELVRALRKTGDPSIAKDLMNFVGYSDSKIRAEAVYTEGRLRYHEAVPELARLYENESAQNSKTADKNYRERLLDALAFIGDPASKDLFAKEQMNPDDLLRLHAVEGLARIGDPSMVTDISRNRLHEKDPKIQTAQAYALYRMGRKEYLDALVSALSSRKTRDEAKQYLVEFRTEQLPELYAHVNNNDVGVREGLAEVFGLIGDSGAIQPLQELSKDRRGQISGLANQAIRRINARMAVQQVGE